MLLFLFLLWLLLLLPTLLSLLLLLKLLLLLLWQLYQILQLLPLLRFFFGDILLGGRVAILVLLLTSSFQPLTPNLLNFSCLLLLLMLMVVAVVVALGSYHDTTEPTVWSAPSTTNIVQPRHINVSGMYQKLLWSLSPRTMLTLLVRDETSLTCPYFDKKAPVGLQAYQWAPHVKSPLSCGYPCTSSRDSFGGESAASPLIASRMSHMVFDFFANILTVIWRLFSIPAIVSCWYRLIFRFLRQLSAVRSSL